MMRRKIYFDPILVEEVVFLEINRAEKSGNISLSKRFFSERERLYEQKRDAERGGDSFHSFYVRYFQELGFQSIFEKAIASFNILCGIELSVIVLRVWRDQDEGAELYGDDERKTVRISIRVTRFFDRESLSGFLDQELLHISDLLDPAFCYPENSFLGEASLGGLSDMENNVIRGRFRLLWNIYVEARLQKMGKKRLMTTEERRKEFETSFSHWSREEIDRVFARLISGSSFAFEDLVELARNARLAKPIGLGGLRCPLCHFPSYQGITNWEGSRHVVELIKRDFPSWESAEGACLQCYELYCVPFSHERRAMS
ncbi:MAG: hypothetical protein HY391_05510 [Deltaproteobacteria bacterium]|nr:hypothetical protein [Deltaproteobacteria bacterium]